MLLSYKSYGETCKEPTISFLAYVSFNQSMNNEYNGVYKTNIYYHHLSLWVKPMISQ